MARAEPPPARALWTVTSDDCVSVHADGDPWQECGFQDFAATPDGSRLLTVSAGDTVQLWNGEGAELRRFSIRDEPGGASGYPDARLAIVGGLGVVVVHQNQLLVLDLADGRVLTQRVLDGVMSVRELRALTPGRLVAEVSDRRWNTDVRELSLPGGALTPVRGVTGLARHGPGYWVTGGKAPFTIHFADPARKPVSSPLSCMPVDEAFCTWRDWPGRNIYLFEIARGAWRTLDTGRRIDGSVLDQTVVAGGRPYTLVCSLVGPPTGWERDCALYDFDAGTVLHTFRTRDARATAALDERGRPEVRLQLRGERDSARSFRVSATGEVRVIDPAGRANLLPPGGGLILADADGKTGVLADAAARPIARLPFPPLACGYGWPAWSPNCRAAGEGRWLVLSSMPAGPDTQDVRHVLTLYDVAGASP